MTDSKKRASKSEMDKAYKEGRVVDKSGSSIDKKGKRINNTAPERKKK